MVFAALLMALTLGINVMLPKVDADTAHKAQAAQPVQPAQVAHVTQVN